MTRLSVTVASHSMLLQSLPNSESLTIKEKVVLGMELTGIAIAIEKGR
jgi:hypothetical protein